MNSMWELVLLPFVFVMEALDALMALIPRRLWNWLWRDARATHSGAIAVVTDTGIRVVLFVLVVGTALVGWWLLQPWAVKIDRLVQ